MAFDKTYDEVFSELLTGFANQIAGADVSQGSVLYLLGAAIAAGILGNYENQSFVARQFSPSLMTDANILRYGADYGLTQDADETISEYRIRVLSHIRQRPAGGTKLDYQREALAVTGVKVVRVLGPEDGQVAGNVKVIILSDPTTGTTTGTTALHLIHLGAGFVAGMVEATVTNTDDGTTAIITAFNDEDDLTIDTDIFVDEDNYSIDSVIPSTNLIDSVESALNDFKPITVELTVQGATVASIEDITMAVSGEAADITSIETDIAAYVNGLDIGETLFVAQLESIAINNGALTVSVSAPAADVSPTATEIVLLGTVTVT